MLLDGIWEETVDVAVVVVVVRVTFQITPVYSNPQGTPNVNPKGAPAILEFLTSFSPILAIYRELPSGLNFKPVGLKLPSAVFSEIKFLSLKVDGSNIATLCPIICPITEPILIPNLELAVKWVCGASVPYSPIKAMFVGPNLLLFVNVTCGTMIDKLLLIQRRENPDHHFLFEDADFSIATIKELIKEGEKDAEEMLGNR